MRHGTRSGIAAAAIVLTGMLGAAGPAMAAPASGVHAAFCGNWYKLTANHTLYRTASGFTPKGNVPAGRVVPDYGRAYNRMSIGDGWIAAIDMKIDRQGTCPA